MDLGISPVAGGARRPRLIRVLGALIILAGALSGVFPRSVAQAGAPVFTGTITGVPVAPGGVPVTPLELAIGPDHNLWLTVDGQAAIVRLTTAGVATKFSVGITAGSAPTGITAGPDGNLWFTELDSDKIARITPTGTVTEFSTGVTAGARPARIVSGPDGNLWFSESGRAAVGRITPSGAVTEFTTGLLHATWALTVGLDGNLWFGGANDPFVARVTTAGVISTFATTNIPGALATGPNGIIYLTGRSDNNGHTPSLESITPTGVHAFLGHLTSSYAYPDEFVIGPDGAFWISSSNEAQAGLSNMLRVTVSGTIESSQAFDAGSQSNLTTGVATGPDGNVWTTVASLGKVAKIGFATAPGAPTGVAVSTTGDAQVTLHWTAPPSDPDAPTTGFHVTPYANGVAQPVRNFDASTTTRVITGLTNGTSYTFRVTATNSIGTSDPSATSAPVTPRRTSDEEAFVKATYQDFLERPPTGPELDTWTTYLQGGGSRSTLVAQLAASDEWVSAIVTRFYTDTLGRSPDSGGLAYWDRLITSGRMTVAQVASQLYASEEYYTHFGGGTPRSWVSDLYTKILRRPPVDDPTGVDYWVRMVASHGRVAVAYSFYQSLESRMDRVDLLYESLLHRPADLDGQAYWAGKILDSGDVTLAKYLALSAEYYASAATRFP